MRRGYRVGALKAVSRIVRQVSSGSITCTTSVGPSAAPGRTVVRVASSASAQGKRSRPARTSWPAAASHVPAETDGASVWSSS
jgi:hypothetical protein